MKTLFVLLAVALTACQSQSAAPEHQPPPQHRGTGAGSSSAGAATLSGRGQRAGLGSWYGMCELNRKITNARSAQEREAILEQAMPNISQETREQQMQMMQQSCP